MAEGRKLSRAEVMKETGKSGAELDQLAARARGGQKDATWDPKRLEPNPESENTTANAFRYARDDTSGAVLEKAAAVNNQPAALTSNTPDSEPRNNHLSFATTKALKQLGEY